jgi:hypothetical protein
MVSNCRVITNTAHGRLLEQSVPGRLGFKMVSNGRVVTKTAPGRLAEQSVPGRLGFKWFPTVKMTEFFEPKRLRFLKKSFDITTQRRISRRFFWLIWKNS